MYNNRNYDYNRGYDRGYEGYGPARRPQRRKPKVFLNGKEYDIIRRERFSNGIKVREVDIYIARCVHKDPNTGAPAYSEVVPGTFKCSICGTEWPTEITPPETVARSCQDLHYSLQNLKIMLDEVDISEEAVGEVLNMDAILKVYPKLYETVLNRFYQSMESYNNPSYNRRARSDFDSLDSFVTSGYGGRRDYRDNRPYYTGDRYDRDYDSYRYERQPEEYYGDPRRGDYDDRYYDRGYDRGYYDDHRYDRYDRGYDSRYDDRGYDRDYGRDYPPAPRFRDRDGRRDSNPFRKNDNGPTNIPISDGGNNNQQPKSEEPAAQVPPDQKVVNSAKWKI